ncbi:MAG TPA: condensation domain-containing protein, partial [Herpetosiphonaceae bacterium]
MRLVAYIVEEQKNKETKEQMGTATPPSPVVTGEGGRGDEGLLTNRGEGLTSILRAFLGERLPAYMVPSAFVILDTLPLTPNGKVDRKALPQPEPDRAGLDTPLVAPRTPMEELVAQIWAEVLHLEQIGIHDNILELGVHSLLATQVVSRIRQQLGVALPIAALFEAPTIADLAQRIEAMRDATRDDAPPLQPQPREGWLPLSFAQQRVWFFDQWLPNNPAYNLPFTYRLTGPLNVDALHESLSAILRRHEALRTTFVASNGQPAQVIRPDTDLALPLVDLRAMPDADRETAAQRLLSDEAHRPFDLARDLLIRALLLRMADDEHVLLLTIHHIIFDGWSEGVLLRELTALYAGYTAGEPHPENTRLPELPVQYADFTLWQRELLQGAVLHQQLDYWRKQLAGVPVLDLPTDYPRPATLSFEGTQQRFLLPPALSAQLRTLSRQEGVTLYMTLLATFQVLLHRYTGQHDIAVGSPIAGRTRREVEGLLGFFVNTLVLRSDLSGNPSFRALLRHVRDTALGAYAHQDVPFEQVLEAVQPERDMSFTPLFQVMFVLQNAPKTDLALPDVQAEPIDVIIQNARFDLTVMLHDTDAGMVGQIEYNTQLFTAATMQRLSTHFEELLERVVADPDQRIGWLPLLSAVEQQQILRDWNTTAGPYPAQACIHQLFEAHVSRAPDAPAVVWMEHGQAQHTLSYAELNARANQLAHALQDRGVGPEMCVGVCLDRSPALVIALLAVLKAGGAYLPLDPAYPADRLKFMLDDSRAPLLITEQRLSGTLPEHAAQVFWIDVEREAIAQQPTDSPRSSVTARNLAYVIYTSGSTGRPKGVPLEHQGAANVAQSQVDVYGISPGERVLHSAALSFDASIFEVMMALLSGATLYQAPAADLMPGPALSALLRTAAITNITLTPSALSALPADDFSALRTVIAVGEASSAELVARWATDDRTVFNGYGPTEVTIWATSARVRP